MSLEQQLCKVFCDGITVYEVPAGLAVATAFEDGSGDRLAFYIVRDRETNRYRIEDDGSLVPTLHAIGSKVTDGQRARVFGGIVGQAGVAFDEESGELRSEWVDESEVPYAALRFVTMLMKVSTLWSMRTDLVVNTFREDAISRIKAELGDRMEISERQPVSEKLKEFEADLVLRPTNGLPVAVFVGVSDARLYEAIFLRMAADHEVHEPCSVVAVLDRDASRLTTARMRQRAQNRLDGMPVFYGEESAAVALIAKRASSTARVH